MLCRFNGVLEGFALSVLVFRLLRVPGDRDANKTDDRVCWSFPMPSCATTVVSQTLRTRGEALTGRRSPFLASINHR